MLHGRLTVQGHINLADDGVGTILQGNKVGAGKVPGPGAGPSVAGHPAASSDPTYVLGILPKYSRAIDILS